ncbi:Glycoside hydrolase, family 3 domain protein [Candidatus Sulfotelmatomonas gaucii]|uniref:beta-glucosidase n=1 Tax=Candidatus Sulfuritelmatomonas gaucii TaxID=2043161 RepID=A0A2N9LUE6_9BACT|nr:Glycoside hydrolase, family 3 domain protein [Candidatus Sulfotelmatomonas gaucii]
MTNRTAVRKQGRGAIPAYKNTSLPSARRAKDLLGRMTLQEKAAQMVCIWQQKPQTLVDAEGNFDAQKAKAAFRDRRGLGQVGRPSDAGKGKNAREMAELTNAIQKFFLENSRLGIPVMFHEECLHGHAAVDGTSFPQPIALGATFNPELVEQIFTATAAEAALRGTHQALTPVVDVAREPRWGRVEETYGEDPFLVSRLGIAAVRGFQGDKKFRDKRHVIATLKHFVGHGQPESGMNCAPANVSLRVLRETFLYSFREALREAGAISIMASYNEIDGIPSHANKWLMRDVLRKEWGFKGFVVSDYFAIWELGYRPDTHGHFVAANRKESCALAVKAGINIELPDPDCYLHLVELVRKGILKERELDELVEPMLFWKFEMGLFDDPYVDPAEAERVTGCDEHRKIALTAAHEAITLLKNENNLAPLDLRKIKSIAVIGPNANRTLLGGYSGRPKQEITVLEGIRKKAGKKAKVLYSEGCKITIGGNWNQDEVVPSDPEEDRKQIAEAVEVAKQADVIVLAIGGNEQTSREAWSLQHMGDRTSLDLIGRQEELVQAMLALGKPVIVFLFNGRPLSINSLSKNVPVIYECWYLGQETGRAVADVLFGDYNPGGKLPISVPRSAGHLPVFYNYKPSARRGYLWDNVSPIYAFGYGLSYTNFSITNPRLTKKRIPRKGTTRIQVDVTNTGGREGTEVVQLYIRDVVSSVTRPVKELKAFKKVRLQPGESTTVTFDITPAMLSFYDVNMKYVVELGDFELMIGNSSRNQDLTKLTLQVSK